MSINIGTSGWIYKHWNKTFYEKLDKESELSLYSRFFSSVEVNSVFYRTLPPSAAQKWRKETPSNFVFATKLNRFITHRKLLIDDEKTDAALDRYFASLQPLGIRLRSILIQLPPRFKKNTERLDTFLAKINKAVDRRRHPVDFAVEFRHDSWFDDSVYHVLQKHNAAFTIATYQGEFTGDYPVTASSLYVRFHATPENPDYSKEELTTWAEYLKQQQGKVDNMYIYFNNDFETCAPYNAQFLQNLLR